MAETYRHIGEEWINLGVIYKVREGAGKVPTRVFLAVADPRGATPENFGSGLVVQEVPGPLGQQLMMHVKGESLRKL